jgi:putative ABC transport system substrate-binding protein
MRPPCQFMFHVRRGIVRACRSARFALGLVVVVSTLIAPLVAEAQPSGKVARIGYLSLFEPRPLDDVFRQAMRDLGWVEGKNLVIEYRSAERNSQRLRPYAEELVRLEVAVIVTASGAAAQAAKDVTRSVPIVMAGAGDAVGAGIVSSLARPGGNVTGTTNVSVDTIAKRLGILKETIPRLSRVTFLGCLRTSGGRRELKELQTAADALGLKLQSIDVPRAAELKSAIEKAVGQRAEALMVGDCPGSFHPQELAAVALQHRLPTMVAYANYVQAGSLMTYGANQAEQARRAAAYVDKILRGAKPADLPVEQATKFELVINLKTARALGLAIPQPVLLRADEVIQ